MKYLSFLFAGIFLILGSSFSQLFAQHGLHLQFLPDQAEAQFFQPAHLASMDSIIVGIGGIGGYDLANNAFTLETLLADDQFLDQQDKDVLIRQLGTDNRLNLGYQFGGILHVRIGNFPISVSYSRNNTISVGVQSPETVGLLLYGNARYAGQTLSDDDVFSLNQTYDAIGVGTAFKLGKLSLGVRAKFLIGSRMNAINSLSYSLTTAPLGTQIDLQSTYDIFETNNADDNHTGFAFDIGGVFKASEKLELQFAARDLGQITWDGEQFKNSVDINYRGVFVENILDTRVSGGSNLIAVDTIQTLFFPDSMSSSITQNLPSTFSLGGSFRLSNRDMVFTSLHFSPSKLSPLDHLPLVNLGYHRTFGRILTIGANIYGGDVDEFGLGLFGRANFSIANRHQISLFYALENGIGLAFPAEGKGYGMQAGLSLLWGQ